MIHVGEAAFFERVYDDAARHDIILLEGVRSKNVWALTRSYRWLPLKRLNLVLQPKFDPASTAGQVIRADISGEEFNTLRQRIPWCYRWTAKVIVPLPAVHLRISATRERLADGMSEQDLTSRDDILDWGVLHPGFRHAIREERDKTLCDHLSKAITEHADQDCRIAVIYGAGHMASVLRHLDALGGYGPRKSQWLTVFSLN